MRITTLDDLKKEGQQGLRSLYPGRTKIAVGMATCGIAAGAEAVFNVLTEEVRKQHLDVRVTRTGCIGFCQQEPLVDVLEPGKPRVSYGSMTPEKARELVAGLAQSNGFHKEWAVYRTDEEEALITRQRKRLPAGPPTDGLSEVPLFQEHPFFRKQKRIVLRNCGVIDPGSIEEYIARGGYQALCKAVRTMTPGEVIQQVKKSGLRGRGGAGFPTGKKWELCRRAPGRVKYVVVNADEGDPGAFMDRSVLEGDPHSVLEGLAVGAYAIGAKEGYVYVRAEYPLALERLRAAVKQAHERGLLGEDIFGSGFDFKVHIVEGAGAFVCGEETGLLASIEGRVGEPRPRPPFPAEKGLWDRPTNINNVKTWATIAPIIARGPSWYAATGTSGNRGTTVFSLVGKIRNNGLVEVPLGIKLREMIFDIGGGLQDDNAFKAVQTGGPSGGCIPEELIDLPVDYEHLTEAGSMMGSGGMIVMDENTCMVDVARYFLEFTTDESCGKCTPCREGTKQMLRMLTRITEGKGNPGDTEKLQRLAGVIKDTSLCGLGATAPNPVLTTIRYFRDEYEAHIRERRCPGHVCRELIHYSIDAAKCIGCLLCLEQCPTEGIVGERKTPHYILDDKCIKCGACVDVCPVDAVVVS